MSKLTPMMRQYQEAKNLCGTAILFFRMGDFYEMFGEDALKAAPLLGLAITTRDKGEDALPMAGFPHHQLDSYIARLLAAGQRAAVCEQMEDPALAKGIVKREVTRIVSAGTVVDETLLDPRASNYLAAIAADVPLTLETSPANQQENQRAKSLVGLAWIELSTGAFYAMGIPLSALADQLARIAPVECLLSQSSAANNSSISNNSSADLNRVLASAMITTRPDWAFGETTALQLLTKQFQTQNLEGFGFDETLPSRLAIRAAGGILDYLAETQRQSLTQIRSLAHYRSGQQLEMDESSRRSLEITRTIREGRREGSLLGVLDHCTTSMGSRLLAEWLAAPLTDLEEITARQDAVAELQTQEMLTRTLTEHLRRVYDLQRLLTRVVQRRASPRDLASIAKTLPVLPLVRELLAPLRASRLQELTRAIEPCTELRAQLSTALVEEAPLTTRDGGVIKTGYDAELDEYRTLARGGKEWIAAFQEAEVRRTGITSLKVGFNRVFGYYIEITHTHRDKVPAAYMRKQTLTNAERYITPELKEYEEKVLSAEERALAREEIIFEQLVNTTTIFHAALVNTALALTQLDVLNCWGTLARQRNYCRPQMTRGCELEIRNARHPVLDVMMRSGEFVPNDVSTQDGAIALITGPNMAGKSTFIRQLALITIMAQMGSFVPATTATIGMVDRIFARVGASDELARGQSTFMVEMTETARILHNATAQSLVILDEIGRGTSTYDGISLAWSIVEFLHHRLQCRTFFATHYHELTALADSLDGVVNLNVAVKEHGEKVVFLHRIERGCADKSYGIHVARLAGVPHEVIDRAQIILTELEQTHTAATIKTSKISNSPQSPREITPKTTFRHQTAEGTTVQFSLFGEE